MGSRTNIWVLPVHSILDIQWIHSCVLEWSQLATTLYLSADYKAGRITWLGGYDLGLPVVGTIREDVDMLIAGHEARGGAGAM